MKLTVDILEDFINTLDLSGPVISFTDDGASTILTVEKTFHARRGMVLDVDGNPYTIEAVTNNNTIQVAGVIVQPERYILPNPFYFHGTPIMTNANHIKGADSVEKLPMIYLYEILREVDKRPDSRVVKEADLRLFFMDTANYEEWTTDDHYSQRLQGLNNLVDAFIEAARAYRCCFYLYNTDFTRINHVNWGVFVTDKGHRRRIFDDDLTGVELNFTLSLKKCN